MILKIDNTEVIQFIQDHLNTDPIELVLRAKKYPHLPIKEIAVQIASRRKVKDKLPEWYANQRVIFPPKENLEQASSEITARFKSRWVRGKSIVDLTGGSGIDLFYMSTRFDRVHYVEINSDLAEITKFNFKVFGKRIEITNTSAEKFLEQSDQVYDVIYIDPSRRTSSQKKVFGIDKYQPNVIDLKDLLLKKGKQIVIKVSPMVDIKHSLKQLSNAFKVQVLAVDNEVKEILFYLSPEIIAEPTIEAWDLSTSETEHLFSFNYEEESSATIETSEPRRYLYEPSTAIRKAGAFRLLGKRFGLIKLARNTHLYTSEDLISGFPGRTLELKEIIKPSKKNLDLRFPDGKINVISKNFPMGANEIKSKFKLHDGGEDFLIFCEAAEKGKIALHCKKAFRA